ncbi:Alkaline ceramidase 3 like protein [Verticillium longisporum]|nr:Alkaline ceramidase 3 like protein [Verticillium longisporum]
MSSTTPSRGPSFGFPYDDSNGHEGFWGPKTVTLNFCEEDYVVSYYCAEICNTLTNLLFLWLGVRGIQNCLKHKHDRIFVISFLGYIIVGAGSTAFHSTLKYPMQLVDELSMIYTTCVMCFATFTYRRSNRFSACLGLALMALAAFITAYYHISKDPLFHQNSYGILTAIVLLRSVYVMETELRPKLHAQDPAKAKRILATMWLMVGTGLAVFLGGFFIWNLDNHYCNTITRWRRRVGLPWGILLEGHGWWHLMTGLGGYYYIVWGIWLRRCLGGRENEYKLLWQGHLLSVPQVVRVKEKV